MILLIPSYAKINCSKFKSWQDANKYYQSHSSDRKALDRNSNGIPCEHLKKGSSKKKAQIRIYKYGSPSSFGQTFNSIELCEKERVSLTKSHIGTDYTYKCIEK